jgi:hypothetical protein
MDLSKFLTYWSLTFAILIIWGFSIAVALADVKDEFLNKLKKQPAAAAKPGSTDPLAGRSVAETLRPPAMTKNQAWVFELVSQIAATLRLDVKIAVLQDSMDHYLVHFIRGKQLVSYRVDKAWVADAMAGKADQRERIQEAVGQYLRQEFFGEKMTPKAPAAPAKAPAGSAPAASRPATPPGAAPAVSSGAPPAGSSGAPPAASSSVSPPAGPPAPGSGAGEPPA